MEKENHRIKQSLLGAAGNIHAKFLADQRYNEFLNE